MQDSTNIKDEDEEDSKGIISRSLDMEDLEDTEILEPDTDSKGNASSTESFVP